MKFIFAIFLIGFIFTSCNKTELEKEFSCSNTNFSGDFEKNIDVKKMFSVQIPTHWKTNFFYNDVQSSIYFADTTKQLTETTLIDITQINNQYKFDTSFENIISKNDSIQELINFKKKSFTFSENKAYYSISKGKKGKFSYQILNIFINKNPTKSFHIKSEIYGNSLINERLCKAIHLIETIELY